MHRRVLNQFLKSDAAGGIVLAASAAIALVIANSGLGPLYHKVLDYQVSLPAPVAMRASVMAWIKDGLMAVFFYVVGLELKRELVIGDLSKPGSVLLPAAAALGGMVVPGLVYLSINLGGDMRGWLVPVATDIAFALAALALVAPKAPPSLRVFLLTLAVVDDLGAVILIAILFSHDFVLLPLIGVGLSLASMLLAARFWRRAPLGVYGLGALASVLFALKSGLHTSVVAVAAAFMVPLVGQAQSKGPLDRLEGLVQPVSTYLVLPLFALATAGISFTQTRLGQLGAPMPLGIVLGLALGKPAGVLLAAWIVTRAGLAKRPEGSTVLELLGVACLCGIGFTMSMFLGALAFANDSAAETSVRFAVMAGSLIALLLGAMVFALSRRARRTPL